MTALDFRLDGRVALVTGASRGLGAGIARALADAGARVVGTSREPGAAREIGDALGTDGVVMDVAHVDSIRAGVDAVVARHGRIDVLVNNAGVNIPQPVLEVDEASWDTVHGANLKGTFFAAQAAAQHMAAAGDGGCIINITSQAGEVAIEDRAAYCSSKGGAKLLTKVLAIELAAHRIRVNAVAPTFVETELTRETLATAEARERVLSRIPMRTLGQVEDVAAAVVYLASPAARLVTGHTLLVDGGWTAW